MLTALVTLLLTATAPLAPEDRPPRAVVAEALERAAAGEGDPLDLRANLAAVDRAGFADLFAVHVAGGVGTARLDTIHAAAVTHVLQRSPHLRPFLRDFVAAAPDAAERTAALDLLGAVGRSEDLQTAVDVASAGVGSRAVERDVLRAFERCLRGVVAHDPDAASRLPALARRAHISLFRSLLAVLEEHVDAARLVGDLLGQTTELEPVVLATLGRLGRDHRLTLDDDHLRRVRRLLAPETLPTARILAARVAAVAMDADAIEALIAMLEDGSDAERDAASAALERISRQRLRYDADAWQAWYERETRWWRDEFDGVALAVGGRDAAGAAAAICTLSAQRLWPDRVARALAPAVRRSEPEIVQLAVGALGQVPSDLALEHLVGCLDHQRADVRQLAHEALVRRTGRDLPPQRQLWESRLLTPRAPHHR